MGAVESLQSSSSFHEFRLFGGRNTASADSVIIGHAASNHHSSKNMQSASACLPDYESPLFVSSTPTADFNERDSGWLLSKQQEDRYSLVDRPAVQRHKQSASMPHLPSVIENIRKDVYMAEYVKPQETEQQLATEKRRPFMVASLQQRLSRRLLSRSRKLRRQHRRYSSGSTDQQSNVEQAAEKMANATLSIVPRRHKSLPNMHTSDNSSSSSSNSSNTWSSELNKELAWLSIDEPLSVCEDEKENMSYMAMTKLPEIEAGKLNWDDSCSDMGSISSLTLSEDSFIEEDAEKVEDEAVADYMYLTAACQQHNNEPVNQKEPPMHCSERYGASEVRRWWPRRVLPVHNMQYMPKLGSQFLQKDSEECVANDYWDVLSRCPMRPTSSLALTSLREMTSDESSYSSHSSSSSSIDSSYRSNQLLTLRAKPSRKRVLSEPMQYILYNSYLRYYGQPDKPQQPQQ
ncbi:hypothetical protein IWW36_000962 [Coemansia brasiliensis]|uniref:Uncharacterized protein n=1 Tax=Coemansia brasiliensis TaxID=2650707 RepID=A0A9W8LZI1_9FUNG|nr:hypothetical protein IWW36_000962 [Coemansia brasiliensis]